MPGLVGVPTGTEYETIDQEILTTLIPDVESRYNVSSSVDQRAFAGLSQGSGITNSLLFNHTDEFAYYGSFSRGPSFLIPTIDTITDEQISDIQKVKGIFVGSGWEERLHPYSLELVGLLTAVNVTTQEYTVHGGHNYNVWRQLLKEFLTQSLFRPSLATPVTKTPTVPAASITITQGVSLATSATVGQTLSTVQPQVSVTGANFSYQWLRNGAAISGATTTRYTVTATDLGKRLSVKVTVSKSGYASATTTSAATSAVKVGTIAVKTKAKVAGKAKVGKKLTARKPVVSVASPSYTYRWYAGGKTIKGATKSTYTIKKANKGKKIKVKVTVKKAGYSTATSTSAATAKVK